MRSAALLASLFGAALALLAPPAALADERLRTHPYDPAEVVKIDGKVGVQATIAFEEGELIENVAVGDSAKWQITPNKRANLLFVKPLLPTARTNMTVVTDKRTYFFDLVASASAKPLYMLRFTYAQPDLEPEPALAANDSDPVAADALAELTEEERLAIAEPTDPSGPATVSEEVVQPLDDAPDSEVVTVAEEVVPVDDAPDSEVVTVAEEVVQPVDDAPTSEVVTVAEDVVQPVDDAPEPEVATVSEEVVQPLDDTSEGVLGDSFTSFLADGDPETVDAAASPPVTISEEVVQAIPEANEPDAADEIGIASDALPVSSSGLNFMWSSRGDSQLFPSRVYDDGSATYLAWPSERETPAIFVRDSEGEARELEVRILRDTIVIDAVPAAIEVRSGDRSATLENMGETGAGADG